MRSYGIYWSYDDYWSLLMDFNRNEMNETKFQDYSNKGWKFTFNKTGKYLKVNGEVVDSYDEYKHRKIIMEELSEFGTAFSEIHIEYGYGPEQIYHVIPTVDIERQSTGEHINFPNNIVDIYGKYYREGNPENWLLVGKLTTDKYFFYRAWCDITGLYCDGDDDVGLYICDDYQLLLESTMTNDEILAVGVR